MILPASVGVCVRAYGVNSRELKASKTRNTESCRVSCSENELYLTQQPQVCARKQLTPDSLLISVYLHTLQTVYAQTLTQTPNIYLTRPHSTFLSLPVTVE